ncbi:hypothetical protein A4H97_33725 [Niastella yeongjuensis]|uniref:DUF4468 domain-containing protein n=1 Tax=Niastella yeongjuensis TaxID=354355 RepID=A0A1V9EDD6_9BACT|nr:hypothetical protein [Niastella yeongjuensis]OQP44133.1 hypothetical protein A4H97_33725 [Niastella yeongjuensis]SEP49236.1 hypothetical protein SAMN05660816_06926 [Niastella yeongjuensis]
MRYTLFVLLLISSTISNGQDLSTDPQTGLVWIHDSVEINSSNLQEVRDYLTKWGHTLLDGENLKAVYNLSNAKQTEMVAINLPVGSVLTREMGGNKFSTNGTLTYSKVKTVALTPVVSSGGVKFSMVYTVRANKLIYEFTGLEYSHDMVHYGKFEDEKPPKDSYNSSLLFKMGKSEWLKVRQEYYANVQVLANNLKEYVNNLIGRKSVQPEQSRISYAFYQAIKADMPLDEIKQLLGDEGKELSSGTVQVNGKSAKQQTIAWYDLDNTKSITVTFLDGKVVSKSQTKL